MRQAREEMRENAASKKRAEDVAATATNELKVIAEIAGCFDERPKKKKSKAIREVKKFVAEVVNIIRDELAKKEVLEKYPKSASRVKEIQDFMKANDISFKTKYIELEDKTVVLSDSLFK